MKKASLSQVGYLVSLGMPRTEAEKLSKQQASRAIDQLKLKKRSSRDRSGNSSIHAKGEQSRKLSQSGGSGRHVGGEQAKGRIVATLKGTSDEYRLRTDYSQRDLARQIKQGRWDPLLQCWVFPKTKATLDAIRVVFAGQLRDATAGRIAVVSRVMPARGRVTAAKKDQPDRPLLRETSKHYCLYVLRTQKRRAMTIPEYRLDPRRGCWVYPKLRYIYDAILKEFGKNLCNEASAPEQRSFPPPTRFADSEAETEETPPKSRRFCEECGQRLHPLRLEVKRNVTTCAKCDGGSDGGSFKQLDASEQWFRRDQSWISKANRKGRR